MTDVNPKRQNSQRSYALPLAPVLFIGALAAAAFYALILSGPLDIAILRRYCLSHPVAVASVSLFLVGLTGLLLKWHQATQQLKLTSKAASSLRRLVTDGEDIVPAQRAQWLAASIQALPAAIQNSWFGLRISRVIDLQVRRGRRSQLESDLKWLGESDADLQHESLSLLRIINWAMPMLGFLGTVLGISKTLGQLDTEMLATQQQEAMNQLTAGLYVAFDTTAIALVLTVVSMFLQFGVSRLETRLLARIDDEAGDNLISFLGVDPMDSQVALLNPVREMASELLVSVRSLVEEQAALWSRSIAESQRQWTNWTNAACESTEIELGRRLGDALSQHADRLESIHNESNRQGDMRQQQWQTTLSDQARQVQVLQKEICRQTDTLHKLVESTTEVKKLEETIGDSFTRLENIGRIEEASICIGEAVAFLGTSLERAGVIRGKPLRPRPAASKSEPATVKIMPEVDSPDDVSPDSAADERKAA